jgi:signal transduction histidine kinase/CheY-like chemotaxis protein
MSEPTRYPQPQAPSVRETILPAPVTTVLQNLLVFAGAAIIAAVTVWASGPELAPSPAWILVGVSLAVSWVWGLSRVPGAMAAAAGAVAVIFSQQSAQPFVAPALSAAVAVGIAPVIAAWLRHRLRIDDYLLQPRGAWSVVAIAVAVSAVAAALMVLGGADDHVGRAIIRCSLSILTLVPVTVLGAPTTFVVQVLRERDEAQARQRQVEDQLRHSQKMEAMGRLTSSVAHDFNNLLTAIIGYSDLLLRGVSLNDQRRGDIEQIGRAASRATDLTRQMLTFSRRRSDPSSAINVNTALQKLSPMLRRVMNEDINLTLLPRATGGFTRIDGGQLEQVLMNLAVNARDAMPRGGRLTIETADLTLADSRLSDGIRLPAGDYVSITVTDSGVGMPPEVRARVFEPYFTTKEVGKGTGLGLSTVYGIIRQADGDIELTSEPGVGTTFRVLLPRVDGTEAENGATTTLPLPGGTEQVLLVEDDPGVRRLIKSMLLSVGYSVLEASSGRAAIALGSDETRQIDLLMCDVILGDMSGPAVAEALRALRPNLKTLYTSGYTDDVIARTGALDHERYFVRKPFTPLELTERIRLVLDEAAASAPSPDTSS